MTPELASNASDQNRPSPHRIALIAGVFVFIIGEVLGWAGVTDYVHSTFRYFLKPGNPFFASACLGSFLIYLSRKPTVAQLASVIVAGISFEIALLLWRQDLWGLALETGSLPLRSSKIDGWTIAYGAGTGLAAAAALSTGLEAIRLKATGKADEAKPLLTSLAAMAVIPMFIGFSGFFLHMTVMLHPGVIDPNVLAIEAAYGIQTGFRVGQWCALYPKFNMVLGIVYLELPLALAVVYVAERARKVSLGRDALSSFIFVGFFGFLVYHACPVIGPRPYIQGWPWQWPDASKLVFSTVYGASNDLRNCIPSLHTSWALLLYWHTRGTHRATQAFGALFLLFTLLATLGLGQHYIFDLVIAVPFSLAVRSAFARKLTWGGSGGQRRNGFAFGAMMTLTWLIVLRAAPAAILAVPLLVRAVTIASVAAGWWLERQLYVEEERLAADPTLLPRSASEYPSFEKAAKGSATKAGVRGLLAAFAFSGFAGLVYEVVFAKELAHTFGSTAKASTTVLATYMGGLALGSYLGAKLVERYRHRALHLYAYAEAGVGVLCAISPFGFKLVRNLYVSIAHGMDSSSPSLTSLQLALGALVLLPPTVLMGMTMPALAAHLEARRESLGRSIAVLYGANTLGAALGAIVTGYYLMPALGIRNATWLAMGLNFAAALIGLALAKLTKKEVTEEGNTEQTEAADRLPDLGVLRVSLAVLTVGGFVTLALETIYIHLLAIVAGNSVYAFSLMLFSFLLGLGLGAALGRAWLSAGWSVRHGVVATQAALAAAILGGVFLWGGIPSYFGGFANYAYTQEFAQREFIRFCVCAGAMLPVALAIGANYPLVMEWLTTADRANKIRWMGRGMALNTVGNILGALAGTFVLMPMLGSLRALHALAALTLLLALVALLFAKGGGEPNRARQTLGAAVFAPAIALFIAQPRTLDFTELSTGANVYFHAQAWGRVFDHAESADGGLTTVAESMRGDHRVKTLLTNGKFQGDDDPTGEMRAQLGFGMVPLAHTSKRGRALVIGLGTGVSSRTIREAGFANLDVAELSADVANLTRTHFPHTNHRVLEAPNVKLLVTDGRNHLLLSEHKYDLIAIELSSIWFAGAASLYNREFYELVNTRLGSDGVLQQWMQLHRLTEKDIASILTTVRAVFAHAWLYFVGNQGIIIACNHDCQPNVEALSKLNATADLKDALTFFQGRADNILSQRVLDTAAMDAFVKDASGGRNLISTDDNLLLEYSTPKGNVRPYAESLQENIESLRKYMPRDPLSGTHLKATDVHLDGRHGGDDPDD